MPILVHLADEKHSKKILNGGIKIGRTRKGIYCMPVLPNFYVTHQWLRELKSSGAKTLVGVYFRVDTSELVYAGKFSKPHRHIPLGEAIKEIMTLDDPLGYELIIDRKIESVEIIKIKHLSQIIGWRYMPDSHLKKPCTCEFCTKGTIKGNRLRKKAKD
jgi:hypothetical protein